MNVILKGQVKTMLESLVEAGYGNTQSEAIRLAVIEYAQKHLSESQLVKMKLDWIDSQIAAGKRRVLSPEDALGKHAIHLKKS